MRDLSLHSRAKSQQRNEKQVLSLRECGPRTVQFLNDRDERYFRIGRDTKHLIFFFAGNAPYFVYVAGDLSLDRFKLIREKLQIRIAGQFELPSIANVM